jgi:hypothetical protein
MRKMIHAVICDECEFSFEEYAQVPSDAWYEATDHQDTTGHNVRLVHAAA